MYTFYCTLVKNTWECYIGDTWLNYLKASEKKGLQKSLEDGNRTDQAYLMAFGTLFQSFEHVAPPAAPLNHLYWTSGGVSQDLPTIWPENINMPIEREIIKTIQNTSQHNTYKPFWWGLSKITIILPSNTT